MKYKLIAGCLTIILRRLFFAFGVAFLVAIGMYLYAEHTWLAILLSVIAGVILYLYYLKKKGISLREKFGPKKRELNYMSTTVATIAPQNKSQVVNALSMVFDKTFSESTDPAQKVVYSFEATLEGSNTPKRQKTIASIFQEKDFDTVLEVKEDFTSSLNYVGRVLYYTNAIGNIPTDIYEKISNKWGRYSVHYHIRRITIYSPDTKVYRCMLGFDVLVRI